LSWNRNREIDVVLRNLGDLSFQDRRVLVTGGAGFLGSWICDVLAKQGAKVVCMDNFSSGLKSNVSHLLDADGFQLMEHDISQPISFSEKLDLVIHMASRASPFEFEHYPIEILKANTIGVWIALGIAKKHSARLLYTSTSEVYGNPAIVPTPESYNGNVNPVGPRGCYDEAKRCGEAYVTAYKKQYSLDTRIARIFNTYGPRIRSDGIYARALPRFIEQATSGMPITIFGDGTQTRSFTYVADQIEGLLKLAALDEARGSIINIGNDKETKIIDMAKLVLDITGTNSGITYHPLPEDDPLRRRPDISRAKELLGWMPKVDLEYGLQHTVNWFKSQPVLTNPLLKE
jgi:UDP-glucuronate decarboxylase